MRVLSLFTGAAVAALLAGTAISRTLSAKTVGAAAALAATTPSIVVVDADANTSTGAPSVICVARPELGPKLNVIDAPG